MVNCDKCSAENTNQALHCVACGALLPQFSNNPKKSKSAIKSDRTSCCYSRHDFGKVVMKSIFGISVYLLILILGLIFWPNFTVKDIEPSKVKAAQQRAKVAGYSRNFELKFTEQELAGVIRSAMPTFFVQGGSWGTVVPRDVSVDFTGPQTFDVLVTYKILNGSIPFNIVYSIKVPKRGEAPYHLELGGVALGLLPVPPQVVAPLVSAAHESLKKSKISVVMSRIRWGEIEGKQLTFYSRISK